MSLKKIVFLGGMLAVAGCGRRDQMERSGTQQIVEEDNLEFVENARGTALFDLARTIAKVEIGNFGCTGFRLSRNLFMTNNHCYQQGACRETTFTMGVERDVPETDRVSFRCQSVLSYSRDLDYALYKVDVPADRSMDFPSVVLSRQVASPGASLFVAGYPFGSPFKRMDRSSRCNLVVSTPGTWLTHGCDTDSGSSGSPIFHRSEGKVVGIHWGYYQGANNHGTVMSDILSHISANASEAYLQLNIR